jgi:hypothetical protein
MTKIKINERPNSGKDAEKLDHLYIVGRNVRYNNSEKVQQFLLE